jgi:hypothetical protein
MSKQPRAGISAVRLLIAGDVQWRPLARRPPRTGFASFVGAANDLHADHSRQHGSNSRARELAMLPASLLPRPPNAAIRSATARPE